jgi:hypothetical protein
MLAALVACLTAIVAIEIHQVDAGAEREWDILHVPGGRRTFLAFQGLQVAAAGIGLVLVSRGEAAGDALGLLVGAGALLGATAHAVLWRRGEPHFRAPESVASVVFMGAAGLVALAVFLARLLDG